MIRTGPCLCSGSAPKCDACREAIAAMAKAVNDSTVQTWSYGALRPQATVVKGELRLRLDPGSEEGLTLGPAAEAIAALMTELAAQAAQVAAGQALADHARAVGDAIYAQDLARANRLIRNGAAIRRQLFAAFPPAEKGGAQPEQAAPAEPPPSAEIVDLAAALRDSLRRKDGGAR